MPLRKEKQDYWDWAIGIPAPRLSRVIKRLFRR